MLMQYSVFGSILTIGAMLGAIVSGSVADRAGRRGVSANPIPIQNHPALAPWTELSTRANFFLECQIKRNS